MALTGLKIQKLLPRTNCKECGSNTCLAFAMKLAAKKAELSLCPHASEQARKVLGAAAEPPVRGLALGADLSLKIGEETVLYRHQKTFVNQTAIAVNITDTDTPEDISATLSEIRAYELERVGEKINIDMVSITNLGERERFLALARQAWETTFKPMVLRSNDPAALAEAAAATEGSHSVMACATPDNIDTLLPAARKYGHVLALTAPDLNSLPKLAQEVKSNGFDDLLLCFQTHSLAERFQVNTIARRAALKDSLKALGYPHLAFVQMDDPMETLIQANIEIMKYGGICVLPSFNPAMLTSLMTLRLNIYTDPQKPIQVEPKLYPIVDPTPDSPVFVTTNFSLTYFIVSGEIENAGISAWLLVPECEGMSVLTAWAAGKFSGTSIGRFSKKIDLDKLVSSRRIVIPGQVSQISGELEDSMPGWQVIVGPQQATDLDAFIKTNFPRV